MARYNYHFLVILEIFGRFSPNLKVLADVIANIMVDVVTIYLILWQMLLPYRSCDSHFPQTRRSLDRHQAKACLPNKN